MKLINISEIKPNPSNPRLIKDYKFQQLKKSLEDFPDMANVRPIVVNKEMVVLGGNMRLKAMQAAGWKQVPVEVVDWPEEKQRQFIIKDNIGFGEWDWELIANEWPEVEEWGLDVPGFDESKKEEENNLGIFPLSIILNAFEYKNFQLYKKENGLRSDTEAFKSLFSAKEKTNENDTSI